MKTKRHIRGATPFEIYSDLSFEECLYRFEHDALTLKADVERQTDDSARFLIMPKARRRKPANITGSLQRWGDDATRVDGLVFSGTDTLLGGLTTLAAVILIVIVIPAIYYLQDLEAATQNTHYWVWRALSPFGGFVSAAGIFALKAYLRRRALIRQLKDLLSDRRKKMKDYESHPR